MAAVTQIRHRHSDGRAFYDKKLAALKRRVSDAIYRQLQADARKAATSPDQGVREGNRGTSRSPARPALTPGTGSSAKPLPDPKSPYDRAIRRAHAVATKRS